MTPVVYKCLFLCLLFMAPQVSIVYGLEFKIAGTDNQLGGHVKAIGSVSWPRENSCFKPEGVRTCYDGGLELRLKHKVFISDTLVLKTHYETVYSGGDTRRKQNELETEYGAFPGGAMQSEAVEDERRLFDMTRTIDETDKFIHRHRIDRLSLSVHPQWGTISLGRQALTWGNGMLFNPLDLFNPFAPDDIEKDYKIGDDMGLIQIPTPAMGDVQILYVPRRDPEKGDVRWDHSSLAAKFRFATGLKEIDLLAASHYKDFVAGMGLTGYVLNAAWRFSSVWTAFHDGNRDGFLTVCANIDYSLVWRNKNIYGFLEAYYNGLGDRDYEQAFVDEQLMDRIDRGEMFTLGRFYTAGRLQIELHPLLNTYLTVIVNAGDPSCLILPRFSWDAAESIEITAGGEFAFGDTGTEFGGFKIPGSDLLVQPADSIFLRLTCYF